MYSRFGSSKLKPINKKVLDNINFEIPKDKRKIAILGENGSGKSTLFLLMNGILKKKSGQIFIDGEELDYSKKKLIEMKLYTKRKEIEILLLTYHNL